MKGCTADLCAPFTQLLIISIKCVFLALHTSAKSLSREVISISEIVSSSPDEKLEMLRRDDTKASGGSALSLEIARISNRIALVAFKPYDGKIDITASHEASKPSYRDRKTEEITDIGKSQISENDFPNSEAKNASLISLSSKVKREIANLRNNHTSSTASNTSRPYNKHPTFSSVSSAFQSNTVLSNPSRKLSSQESKKPNVSPELFHNSRKTSASQSNPISGKNNGFTSSSASNSAKDRDTKKATPKPKTGLPHFQNLSNSKNKSSTTPTISNSSKTTKTQPSVTEKPGEVLPSSTSKENNLTAKNTKNRDTRDTNSKSVVPVVVYEDDPKWYGNPKEQILDDYEVFRMRGCEDFSCMDDF